MLSAQFRLRDRTLLASTVKRGTRAGRRYVVVHFLPADKVKDTANAEQTTPRVAFAVSRSVGGSVVRHRVTRRLRHVVSDLVGDMPAGCTMVIRALPAAANATSADLADDLRALLPRLAVANATGAGT